MILTEEEARKKWCPHAVASHTNPRMGFDNGGQDKLHVCIASDCMAWRWLDAETEYRIGYSEGGQRLPKPDGDEWTESGGGWIRKRPIRTGFCGLAGQA